MAPPAQTSAMITPQSVRNSKGLCPPSMSQQSALVMDNRAVQRRRADVIRLRADLRQRPEQERAQSIEVLAKYPECGVRRDGRHVRHSLQPDVVVRHK